MFKDIEAAKFDNKGNAILIESVKEDHIPKYQLFGDKRKATSDELFEFLSIDTQL